MIRTLAFLFALTLMGCEPTMSPPPQWVNGYAVEYRLADLPGANGGAMWDGNTPVVYLDFVGISPAHQWWVLAHELCHLEGLKSEAMADCCASRKMHRFDIPVTEVALAADMWMSDKDHPPGPLRAAIIIECYR